MDCLDKLDEDMMKDFMNMSMDLLIHGMGNNTKRKFTKAGKHLQISVQIVEDMIVILAKVLMQSAKDKLNQAQFRSVTRNMKMSEKGRKGFEDFYAKNYDELRKIVNANEERIEKEFPKYKDLDWRLECEIASRSLHRKLEPNYILRLDTSNGESTYLKSDYGNLANLEVELQQALDEAKSVHTQRIMRYIR